MKSVLGEELSLHAVTEGGKAVEKYKQYLQTKNPLEMNAGKGLFLRNFQI